MDVLKELGRFMGDEESDKKDEMDNIVSKAKEIITLKRKDSFDDEVYAELAQIFGDEYITKKIDDIIKALGVENTLTY